MDYFLETRRAHGNKNQKMFATVLNVSWSFSQRSVFMAHSHVTILHFRASGAMLNVK